MMSSGRSSPPPSSHGEDVDGSFAYSLLSVSVGDPTLRALRASRRAVSSAARASATRGSEASRAANSVRRSIRPACAPGASSTASRSAAGASNARVVWLETHDQPYTAYVDQDIHFAVTQANVRYHRSARFDDRLDVTVWLDWVRGASLRMAYCIHCEGELIASGFTEHAAVSDEGKLRRIPKVHRERLASNSVEVRG